MMPKYNHLSPKDFNIRIERTRPGEIYFAKDLPFDTRIGNKSRPVVVVEDQGDRVVCMQCTSKLSDWQYRYKICDGMDAGLFLDTYIVPKLINVPKAKLQKRIGVLSKHDRETTYEFAIQDCNNGVTGPIRDFHPYGHNRKHRSDPTDDLRRSN